MRPADVFDAAARARIERAVVAAERETAGEIVVVVVRACDAYGGAPWRLGVALAALAFLGLAALAPPLPLWWYLAAQSVGLAAGHGLARLDGVRRHLLLDAWVEQRVAERAQRAFVEGGLHRTAGRTGILLFVAFLERRVVVLGDEGIHRALDPDETWQSVVDLAVTGLRRGRAVEGLEEAVARLGEILARHVPAAPRNPDELPNALVVED
jgi:putative membrane protein